MSAFVKRQPATAVDLGTRPGLNGQVLISSGVAGIDKLLGGGVPLGSLLLIIEDSQSQQHLNLLKCFLAEGQAKSASLGTSTSNIQTVAASAVSSSGQGGAAHASAAAPDDGLKIAWQYRKYIQNQQRAAGTVQQPDRLRRDGSSSTSAAAAAKAIAAGVGREWCHHFDLSTSVTADAIKAARLHLECCCSGQQHGSSAVQAAAKAATDFLSKFQPKGPIPVPSRDPASIGRIVLQSVGSPEWWPQSSSSSSSSDSGHDSWAGLEGAMLQAVMKLRLAVQDASCAAVMTCPASLYSASFQAQLQHLSDIVLCVQSLADDSDIYRLLPDPTSAAALLEIRRVPELGLLRQRYSEDRLYLIRMKRRSISVGVLDLIPLEACTDAQGDKADQRNATAADKPTAAKLCGGGPGASSLDF